MRQKRREPLIAQRLASGADRDRTDDLLNAIQALSQLSYSPGHRNRSGDHGGCQRLSPTPPAVLRWTVRPPSTTMHSPTEPPVCQGTRVKKSFWTGLVKYALGLGLLAWVVYRNWDSGDGTGLKDALGRPVQWLPFAIAGAFAAVAALSTFVRWWLLVRAVELDFRLADGLRLGLVGYFFNTFLPGAVGGDIVKAWHIAREQNRRAVAVATVLFDRAVGLWGLVWLVALCGGAFTLTGDEHIRDNAGLRAIVRGSWVVVAATLGGWLLLGLLSDRRAHRFAGRIGLVPRVGHALAECWRAVWLYRRHRWAVSAALVLSLGTHAATVLMFHYAAHAFILPSDTSQIPTLAEHALIVPVGMAIQAFFPAPGGVGGGEWSFGKLYRLVGKPESFGVLASLAQRSLTWILGLAGYLVYLRMKKPDRAVVPEPAAVGAE
jgi:glycosyltransferase 2 family protein